MGIACPEYLQDLSALEKQILVERHLIGREHAAKSGSAVVMNRKQTLSIMINEGTTSACRRSAPGCELKVFKMIDKADSALESKLDFAYHPASATSPPAPATSAPACAPRRWCTSRRARRRASRSTRSSRLADKNLGSRCAVFMARERKRWAIF